MPVRQERLEKAGLLSRKAKFRKIEYEEENKDRTVPRQDRPLEVKKDKNEKELTRKEHKRT